ncbi:3-oxoacyl-(Acyl-carrier protein) reductase [Devosia sp. LC5]|uniref:SDR family oxidoreductase n=1 Tax=Devosia sp. LC5 TaxID=1502724 RepID=UPI0004E2B689|nr:SDR family oxidoreductase [Devosia sp. LC5]KFC69934.1 3-oxoacyl-(Acyl-carrier protein) reductase [Devosia sp. LC5]
MDFGLSGKRALVLGASRGLGAAIAAALAAEGVTVLGASRSGDYTVDLADKASVAALIDKVRTEGGVDILVNNSGGPKAGPAQGQATADWVAAFETMATSLYAVTDALLPQMIERKFGRIITVGSSGVVAPIAGLALSNAVRGAIAGWSKTLAAEVAKHGITVNMVLPGRIDTDRVRELDQGKAGRTGTSVEAVQEASRNDIPAGRYGRPEEFGAVVAFLASQQASYVTGSMLRVDGGMIKGL